MTRTLTPGERHRLAGLGVPHNRFGRVYNRANTIAPKDIPIPRNGDELAEMIGDPGRLRPVLADVKVLKDFIQAYADQQQGDGTDLQRQIKEQAQIAARDILLNGGLEASESNIRRLNLDPATNAVKANSRRWSAKAPGAGLDKMFDNWCDYLATVWERNQSMEAIQARDTLTQIKNSFGSTVPSDGGFLIPEILRSDLLRVALETALVRRLARVIPMSSLTVPMPIIDSTSNASSVYGGVTGYWTEEGGALTDSAPSFGRVVLTAKKLTIYSEIPNELFQDSIISLEAFMSEILPEALAWFEDVAFHSGTGTGEPLGYLNAPAAVSVAKETGQAAGTLLWENIVKMFSRMLPGSLGRAVWTAHIDTFPELATMALSVGTGGSAIWIGDGNGAGAPPVTILGRPVQWTEKVSSVGTAGDINFADFGYYLVGDRMTMQADTSTHSKFQNDKTALRIIERVDGRPWIQSAITPQTGSNALSPFVKVATRA